MAWESPESWLPADTTHFPGTIPDWTALPRPALQPLPVPRIQQDLNGAWRGGHIQTLNIWPNGI